VKLFLARLETQEHLADSEHLPGIAFFDNCCRQQEAASFGCFPVLRLPAMDLEWALSR
jgi:hypothetical protein